MNKKRSTKIPLVKSKKAKIQARHRKHLIKNYRIIKDIETDDIVCDCGKCKIEDETCIYEDVAATLDDLMFACDEEGIDGELFDQISNIYIGNQIPVHLNGNLADSDITNIVLMFPNQAEKFYRTYFENFNSYTKEQLGIEDNPGNKLETTLDNESPIPEETTTSLERLQFKLPNSPEIINKLSEAELRNLGIYSN